MGSIEDQTRGRIRGRLFATSFACLLVVACGDGGATGPQPPASVTITPPDARLVALGDTVRLRALVRDARGAALEQATVTWTSLDAGLATVDAGGLVRALGIGTARITAASGGVSAAATVSIEQEIASITVAPARDTLFVGEIVLVRAEATDRNGAAVTGARFTWSSSDETIASVDTAGRVSARRRGAAVITARSGSAAGTTDVAVILPELRLAADTTLSGRVEVARFEIPAGVTVTVRDSLRLIADDDVVIAGSLLADCVLVDVRAGGALRVAGRVSNACTDSINGEGAPLRLVVDGPIELDDADIVASGDLDLSNDPPAGSVAGRLPPAHFAPISAMRVDTSDCNIRGDITVRAQRAGRNGSPNGEDGKAGRSLNITCRDKLVLAGSVSAGRGGAGGRGDATPAAAGIGGDGGDGGGVSIVAGNGIEIGTTDPGGSGFVYIGGGAGGAGGVADACLGNRRPVALGGHGGDAGSIRVRTIRGQIRVVTAVTVQYHPGGGGYGNACGRDGNHAGAAPAEPGEDARAQGGNAGGAGGSQQVRLLGDIFAGTVVGADRIDLVVNGGSGGDAYVSSGTGGNGNDTHRDGANGGAMSGEGGRGGQSWIWDDRVMAYEPAKPQPGQFRGGDVALGGGNGGHGFGDCTVPGARGGNGGRGGNASGGAGAGGRAGPNTVGSPGRVWFGTAFGEPASTGNGGNGGDGSPPGTGGAAGQNGFQAGPVGPSGSEARLFEPGAPGKPCPGTGVRVGAVIREGNVENVVTIDGFGAAARMTALTSNTNANYFFDRVAATPEGDILTGERNGATGAQSVVRYPAAGGPGTTLLTNANEPMPRPGDGAMLFTRNGGVWGSSASGAGATPLFAIGFPMHGPVWRGNGAFMSWTCIDDVCKILGVNIGSNQWFPLTPTTPGANNRDPALCGDSNTMVFASSDALGRFRIEKMNLLTGARTAISMPPAGHSDRYPACSPDGRYEMWSRFAPDGTSRLIFRDLQDGVMYDMDAPGMGLYKGIFLPII